MRIRDWSSDVCSSDLIRGQPKGPSAKTPEQAQPKPDPPPAYPFQINNVKQPARAGPAQADAAERSAPLHSLRRSRLRAANILISNRLIKREAVDNRSFRHRRQTQGVEPPFQATARGQTAGATGL